MLVSYTSKKIFIAPARNRRINLSLVFARSGRALKTNYKNIMKHKIASLTAAFKTTDAFGAKYAADFPATSTGGQQFALITPPSRNRHTRGRAGFRHGIRARGRPVQSRRTLSSPRRFAPHCRRRAFPRAAGHGGTRGKISHAPQRRRPGVAQLRPRLSSRRGGVLHAIHQPRSGRHLCRATRLGHRRL